MRKVKAFIAWVTSPKVTARIHALVTLGLSVYVSLRAVGV